MTPSRDTNPDAGVNELVVLVDAGAGEGEYMLGLARPERGTVHVREWSGGNWAGPPVERDLPTGEVLARLQRAYDQRRRISAELLRVRAWLDGLLP